jgi:hypothetical protein
MPTPLGGGLAGKTHERGSEPGGLSRLRMWLPETRTRLTLVPTLGDGSGACRAYGMIDTGVAYANGAPRPRLATTLFATRNELCGLTRWTSFISPCRL